MDPNLIIGKPHFGPGHVPYFYAAGSFESYDVPRPHAPLEVRFTPAAFYDFTSGLVQRRSYPATQTVELVIPRGYLAVPDSEPETALISDEMHTAGLGLDDVISQIRRRCAVYEQNICELDYPSVRPSTASIATKAIMVRPTARSNTRSARE